MRQCVLFKQIYKMRKDSDQSMAEYIDKFIYRLEQLEEVGIKLPNEVIPIMLQNSLPSHYETFCIAIESRETMPNMEKLKIKLFEEEIRRTKSQETQGNGNGEALLLKRIQ